jgi:hypothetical protein
MTQFHHLKSTRFPILPGEEEELVNEGMYGKALAEYLQRELSARGYEVPFVCCEDWGWWVQLKGAPFALGVCVYSGERETELVEFSCTDNLHGDRKWSWRKFSFVDTKPYREKLRADLIAIFEADPEIEYLGESDEFLL